MSIGGQRAPPLMNRRCACRARGVRYTARNNASGRGTAARSRSTLGREGYGERERERGGGRWWEGSDMADVTACVGEYRLVLSAWCQSDEDWHSGKLSFIFNVRARSGRTLQPVFPLSLSLQKAGHYSYRLAEG